MYRCRQCGHEEYGGCIPLRGCGLYPLLLFAVSMGGWLGCVTGARWWLPPVPADAPPPEIPWWWWPVGIVVELAALVGTAVALGYALDRAESVWMRRAKCVTCGARNWSEEEDKGPHGWGL